MAGTAALGAAISFAVVLRGMKAAPAGGGRGLLGKLLDAATNRDFSVLVLLLAVVDRLAWFLWLAAVMCSGCSCWGSRCDAGTRGRRRRFEGGKPRIRRLRSWPDSIFCAAEGRAEATARRLALTFSRSDPPGVAMSRW